MAWGITREERLWCDTCKDRGRVACPVDHEAQEPNYVDENGEVFYWCEVCDSGLVNATVTCPECLGGEGDDGDDETLEEEEDDEEDEDQDEYAYL